MNVALALLLFGASGSAERRLDVPGETIAGIIGQVAWGVVEDVVGRKTDGIGLATLQRTLQEAKISLFIDGRERTGILSWLAAVNRVAGYAINRQHAGSIEYSYRLNVRGYVIRRVTRIEDDYVLLTTQADWTEIIPITKRLVRKVPISVTITITAAERGATTHLLGTATGHADTRDFQCSFVRSAADRRASEALRNGLADALAAVERRGTTCYHAGEFGPEFDRLRDAIRAALRIGIGRARR